MINNVPINAVARYPAVRDMNNTIKVIDEMSRAIVENIKSKHITLLFSGRSGSIFSSLLYERLKSNFEINLCLFNKEKEFSHLPSLSTQDKIRRNSYLIFVDDFIVSGNNFYYLQQKLRKITRKKINCICVESMRFTRRDPNLESFDLIIGRILD